MKLDNSTKVVSMFSVIVGLMLSVTGFFTNHRLRTVEVRLGASIDSLSVQEKQLNVQKEAFDQAPRLHAEFETPLAQAFADDWKGNPANVLVPDPLLTEFEKVTPQWMNRRGLMTGNACAAEGLKVRQVVTLTITNVGYADASEIRVKAKRKASPQGTPTDGWRETSASGASLAYDELQSVDAGWTPMEIGTVDVLGRSSPEPKRNSIKVVLASVSGRTTFFGTVLVPLEITWTDAMTKQRHTKPILKSDIERVRSHLKAAEVGTVSSARCQ